MTKINKPKARKLFNEGKPFYVQSCNMTPINPWQSAYLYDSDNIQDWKNHCNMLQTTTPAFDSLVNNYEYYNCDHERGRYSSFYID
jgi:hypothetical protein